jgi:hypothetical protein
VPSVDSHMPTAPADRTVSYAYSGAQGPWASVSDEGMPSDKGAVLPAPVRGEPVQISAAAPGGGGPERSKARPGHAQHGFGPMEPALGERDEDACAALSATRRPAAMEPLLVSGTTSRMTKTYLR